MAEISVIIPACNEAGAIAETVEAAAAAFRGSGHTFEIIVVDDASTDDTAAIARDTAARVIVHPTNQGYGNSLLTGVRNAAYPWIAIADADGTYPVEKLPEMLDTASGRELDMVVGARQGRHYHGSPTKRVLRWIFKGISEWVVGESIPDINSGLRVMRRDLVRAFAPALSGGFSFTTSITIIAFQTGFHVAYVPVDYRPRTGKSHVRMWRDTKRALQIIVMTIVLFNPIKLYLLQTLVVFWFTVFAIVFLALFPQLHGIVLIASLGFFTGNGIMALGFIAVRQQINLDGIALPPRGYEPGNGPGADRDGPAHE